MIPFRTRVLGSLILVVIVSALTACATGPIPTPAFEQLAASMQQVRTGADATLQNVYDRTRERYVAEAAADADKLNALLLGKPKDDPFGWTSPDPPLFLSTAAFRDGVYRFNSVLVEYATLLNQLAAKDLVDPKTFNDLATDLNGNLKSALAAMGQAPKDKEIAIFSTIATAAFDAYLRHQQRSALKKALQANQTAIQTNAELGAAAIRITADALRNEYDVRSGALANAIAVKDLADLDDRFIKELAALRVLHGTFVALPGAHRELSESLDNPHFGLATIKNLFDQGKDLYRRYEDLVGGKKTP